MSRKLPPKPLNCEQPEFRNRRAHRALWLFTCVVIAASPLLFVPQIRTTLRANIYKIDAHEVRTAVAPAKRLVRGDATPLHTLAGKLQSSKLLLYGLLIGVFTFWVVIRW